MGHHTRETAKRRDISEKIQSEVIGERFRHAKKKVKEDSRYN